MKESATKLFFSVEDNEVNHSNLYAELYVVYGHPLVLCLSIRTHVQDTTWRIKDTVTRSGLLIAPKGWIKESAAEPQYSVAVRPSPSQYQESVWVLACCWIEVLFHVSLRNVARYHSSVLNFVVRLKSQEKESGEISTFHVAGWRIVSLAEAK